VKREKKNELFSGILLLLWVVVGGGGVVVNGVGRGGRDGGGTIGGGRRIQNLGRIALDFMIIKTKQLQEANRTFFTIWEIEESV